MLAEIIKISHVASEVPTRPDECGEDDGSDVFAAVLRAICAIDGI